MRHLLSLILAGSALAPLPALAQLEQGPPSPSEPTARPSESSAPQAGRSAVPESSLGGFTLKPRGRLQVDAGTIDVPGGIAGDAFGTAAEVRRAYLGVQGDLPGNFGYRIEADFAGAVEGSKVELTDVYLTYEASDALTFTLGHHKPFGGLEEMTSDLFTSMMERAAFTSAFGFERRVGLSGTYSSDGLLVQIGAFAETIQDFGEDRSDSFSLDGRVVLSPEVAGGTLHLGGSAHYRELNHAGATLRYRARPFLHMTDGRLVDTGSFSASGERNFGVEVAYVRGPFHAVAEGHVMTALRPGLDDPTFQGGYLEVGMLLTPGDTAAYKDGAFDRVKPVHPVTEGGIGAIQLSARYDRLDLDDGAIAGGTQQLAGLSAVWMLTDRVRFLLNYGHLWIDGAAVPAGADRDYQVDTLGLRAQVDF